MSQIRYAIDVFPAGIQTTTGAAAFTLQTSQLIDPPTIGGQLVRAGEGIVETQPCTVTILDINSTFTQQIATTAGRLQLLGRLARIRSSLDSTGSYSTLFTGRVSDLQLRSDVVSWAMTLSDERVIERNTYVFSKANTCSLIPRGLISKFQQVPSAPIKSMVWSVQYGSVDTHAGTSIPLTTGNFVTMSWAGDASHPAPGIPFDAQIGKFTPNNPGFVAGSPNLNADIANFIIGDVATSAFQPVGFSNRHSLTKGNFRTLRWRRFGSSNTGEVDFPIVCFGLGEAGTSVLLDPVAAWRLAGDPSQVRNISILWSTAVHGARPTYNPIRTVVQGYVYAPTHLPTGTIPLHIGGSFGQHPFQILKDIYQGKYNASGSSTLVPRISTAAFDTLIKDPSYGKAWFRVTDRAIMADFASNRVYIPYNVVPLVDAQGRLAPVSMRAPYSTVSPAAVITSTNALTAPTWENPGREAVNAIAMSYDIYGFKMNADGWLQYGSAADGMNTIVVTTTRLGDNVTSLGVHRLAASLGSVSGSGIPYPIEPPTSAAGYLYGPTYPEVLSSVLAMHKFARFQDGPLYSQVDCHRSIDATTQGLLNPGAFVKMRMGTWPNPFTRTRTTSSTRLMQIVQRQDMPTGPRFRMLDAGPFSGVVRFTGPLMALTSNSSRHGITITVPSSGVPVNGGWEVLIAATTSTGAAAPASSSPRWAPIAKGSSSLRVSVLGSLPSHTLFYAKARGIAPGIGVSAWSTATKLATAKIPGTSSVVTTSITAGTAGIKWTGTSVGAMYTVDILLDQSTVAANLGTSRRVGRMRGASTRYSLGALTSGVKHIVGVRFRDPFGGKSTTKTVIVSTTGKSRTVTAVPTLIGNPRLL